MKMLAKLLTARCRLCLLYPALLFTLGACGGGGGGGGGGGIQTAGIGGTGFSSSGTVDGSGSIFVNGERIDVDSAEIFVEGEPATEADLGLGMVVTVSGQRNENGAPIAERVDYESLIEGNIESIERNADNSSARLRVLRQVVIAERTSTVFEDASFDTLAEGQRIEISGYRDDEDRVRATRIEGESDITDEVKVTGRISGLDGTTFNIGDLVVDAGSAFIDLPNGALAEGLRVKVEGTVVEGVLVATEVDDRDDFADLIDDDDDISVQGPISDFQSLASFVVADLPIDASNAIINTGGLPLADNLVVEVEGTWNGTVLVADSVTGRRGRIELEAPLAEIDGRSLTLAIAGSTVQVETDNRTLFDDDRDDIEYLTISDLAVGDFLEVEALQTSSGLLATRVDRDEPEDEVTIQGPVEDFVDGVSIDVLGITFDVTSAEFENAGDEYISAADFFRNLRVGALVKIEDEEPSDGFAEEVEFEFALSFDGERDFLDDDERRIDPSELPQPAIDYLEANFPNTDIAFIEVDDEEIEVYLADGTEVVFTLDGSFIESEREDDDHDEADDDNSEGESSGDDSAGEGDGSEEDDADTGEDAGEESETEESEDDASDEDNSGSGG